MSDSAPPLSDLPGPSERNVTLRVDRSGERALRRGHPWLFADGVTHQSHAGRAGDLAVVFDHNRKFLAIGLYDPASPLRVRVLQARTPRPIDAGFFADRIESAARLRASLPARGTNGYRVINAESEGLPGLVVDRYAATLVVRLDTPAWIPHLRSLLPPLQKVMASERIVLRLSRATARRPDDLHGLFDGAVLTGPALEQPVVFEENRLRFECDPVHGQKTGFFLDQRENRERVERLAEGSRVLNAFAYTGSFSVYAARGGASEILSLDQSEPALRAAERNFALNARVEAVSRARHQTRQGDAFEVLGDLARQGRRFDLVILDPPSFASKQADIPRALAAYERLTTLGLGVLQSGGVLVAASCSSRVASPEFFGHIQSASRRSGWRLEELSRTGHAFDHPATLPEGRYLKCLFARAESLRAPRKPRWQRRT